ncbi:MAG: hypothetical protein WD063_06665 [Pirellulales bacterium]
MSRGLLLALCACAAISAGAGDELSPGPREGVVLLNNGELLAGTIIAAGDRYDVHLETGEISVKRSDVAMVCRDATECYLHRRAGIELGRAQDHLELAEWCIKNALLESAEKELAAARAADAAHPKIRLVESRLALARQPRTSVPAASSEKAAAQVTADGMARDLPAAAVEVFTNTIQPMLLNYCAKSGCHSARGGGGLKLERIHPKRSGRFTTQRNLERVLALVDRQNPSESKLLLAPIRPHGTSKAPVFTDREQSQYKQLALWVFAVAGAGKTAAPPTLAERTAPLLQTVPGARGPQAAEPAEPQPMGGEGSEAGELPPPERRDGSRIPASSAEQGFTRDELRARGLLPQAWSKVQYGADTAPDFVPKDPFDPEIFNRRFFGR